ncbi:hypothetical protein HAZT_HAZT008505, partial [Hyalella azteca]
MVHMGFVNVTLSTIEKRYHLKSGDTGVIAGTFNVAFCVMCLPIAYLASRPGASRSRWIGGGMVMVAAGSLVYATPHFFGPTYDVRGLVNSNSTRSLCASENIILSEPIIPPDWSFSVFYVFLVAQVLMGTGCVPLVVLGVAFIDSSVSRRRSSLFIGEFHHRLYRLVRVETSLISLHRIGLTPANDLWLGCWWLGFLITAVASAVIAGPLLAFPANIQKSKKDIIADGPKLPSCIDDSPPKMSDILGNVTFMSLAIGEISPSMLGAGLGAFLPKVVESQFSLSASTAALLVGVTGVPSGLLGCVFGGWILKKLNVNTHQTLQICFWGSAVLVLSSFSFLIYCPNAPFAGVTEPYFQENLSDNLWTLTSSCNSACGCQSVAYNPVCGSDNLVYYSPCHAGCSLAHGAINSHQKGSYESVITNWFYNCLVHCRCVRENERDLAFALRSQLTRALGGITGPVIFGLFLDKTCLLWEQLDDHEQGSCAIYEHFSMDRSVVIYVVKQQTPIPEQVIPL